MSIRKFWKYGLLMLASVGMLSACGGDVSEEIQESQVAETEQAVTEEEAAENTFSLEALYEKTDLERIYKLANVDTEGYCISNAYMKDGYVLLLMHDYSEEGFVCEIGVDHMMASGKLLLFPIAHPEELVSREVEKFAGVYELLSGGRVMSHDWEGNYAFFDSKLEEVQAGKLDCSEMLGASEDGCIWGIAEETTLVCYQDGKEVASYPMGEAYGGSFLGEWDGKAYFSINDSGYHGHLVSVNLADGLVEKQNFLYQSHIISDGWVNYESIDKWYLAELTDPYAVTAFDKPISDEYLWKMDEDYMVSTRSYLDDSDNFMQRIRVYDRANGGLIDEKKSSELVGEEFLLFDQDQGMVLFGDSSAEMEAKGLYLWDMNGLTAETPAEHYEQLDYHVDQARIDSVIQEIYDKYGVTVYCDQAHLDEFVGEYRLPEIEDQEMLGNAMVRLAECMEEYPQGFFEELKAKHFSEVVFYLAGKHEKTDPDIIDDAAGTASARDGVLRMTLDVNDWWNFRRTFLHENMHLMDNVLEIETANLCSRNIYEHWYNEINSPEIASMQHYNYEETEENLKGVYQYGGDPEEAWYIDAYSKSTMGEDRARILENSIYSASDCYFESSHIMRKARCLNAEIRAVFACVQNSEKAVMWEARTGIVDLKEEFPELAEQN